ncbi:PDZ domain-containing protein [Pelomonas sp. CA6]|uniref:S41 family peptidase n=1 Tax=Pelomonas sp. CA6 TaxID=2907999 RepID=UPI001F4BEFB8|nr:S41 family peptidase [Pelomonas sp. CA6]MCH7345342.1 PDZ domain-containing protein [Pelomonas sp. CA6]
MKLRALCAALILGGAAGSAVADMSEAPSATRLLRQPALSATQLAFVWGGDLWVADRNGAQPRRLTRHAAAEFAPRFSPDGRWIAFSASYDGNTDVYVIPSSGGQPRRLTWHPAADEVSGWSADGKRVLFASPREVLNSRSNQLFEVALEGGYEQRVMDAVAYEGAWSADGRRLAYRPYRQAHNGTSGWRQSRGGTTPPIWIIDPKAGRWEPVPHVNATDSNPLWLGDVVVFISDRNDGAANLFAYDTRDKTLRQLTRETVWDVRSADARGDRIVYEAGGVLKEISLAGGEPRVLDIRLAEGSDQARVSWKDASRQITSARLSATGQRVVVSARGEVFTLPVKEGTPRNLTQSPGVREKDALWSPDGERVAFISDEPGMRHQVVLSDQRGEQAPRKILLPELGYYTLLAWSPDGRRLVLQDNHLNLYQMPLEGRTAGQLERIDRTLRRAPFDLGFSPDGRWLAYTVVGENHFSQIRLADLQTGRRHTLTDGMSDAESPAFSPKGDVLYFMASVNSGPAQVGLDMSTQERAVRLGLFAAVLSADGRSPLLPKSGDEDGGKPEPGDDAKGEGGAGDKAQDKAPGKAATKTPPKPVRIDLDGLAQRIVGLPVAERRYDQLAVAADGSLYYLERRQPGVSHEPPTAGGDEGGAELYRFDFEERKATLLKTGVREFSLSPDGRKLLLQLPGGKMEVGATGAKLEAKPVDLAGLKMRVDPRAEWRQIFDETWWMQKEFFYDPGLHGLDWRAVYRRYLPLLAHVQRREDLNELLVEMIGELQVGHNRVGGGDVHQEPRVAVGLLGADFSLDQGRYRIKTLYRGDRWNPFLKAPLAAPGLGLKEGDYVLSVNGQPVGATQNLYAALENTVGRQIQLSVSSAAQGAPVRQVQVEPIANEAALRQWAWIERNRETVDRLSGGKVAYVYLPDTAASGFQHFNRLFFAQVDKQALIVDDRRNGGGQAANYVTDVLNRPYLAGWKDRDAQVFSTPGGAIYGPKAMLIDQDAGSGGDFLPYAFKRMGLGPLIGKRTWGGLIGIATNPALIDGGQLVVPYFRFFTPEGQWRIENEGVAPDLEVELDPLAVNAGRDTQLEAAVANVLERLKTERPVERKTAPAMPQRLGE